MTDINITWKLPDGSEISGAVAVGQSMLEAAQANKVPYIIGECGGNMSCATCHVYVDDEWYAKLPAAEEFEDIMLDAVTAPRTDNSRLSCQISAEATLDGVVFIVPEP